MALMPAATRKRLQMPMLPERAGLPREGATAVCDGSHGGFRFCKPYKGLQLCANCWPHRKSMARRRGL